MVTGEVQKAKYVYYRCTGHRGKCDLPRFREEDIAARLGEPLKRLQVPPEVASQIVSTLRKDQERSVGEVSVERARLGARLSGIRSHMDAAYLDKLDRKIPEDFWERKMGEWRMEEQQVKMAIQGLTHAETGDRALDAQRILELANKAHSLYVSQNPFEKAKLLRMLFSNCFVDAVSVTPTYKKPFDMIFKRAHLERPLRFVSIRPRDQLRHRLRRHRLPLRDGEQQIDQDRSQGQNLAQQNLVRRPAFALARLHQLRPNPLRERQLPRSGASFQGRELLLADLRAHALDAERRLQ